MYPQIDEGRASSIINYLKATEMELGLLMNFGDQGRLEWKRYVRTKKKKLKEI